MWHEGKELRSTSSAMQLEPRHQWEPMRRYVGNGTWHQAQQTGCDPQNLHSGRREPIPIGFPLTFKFTSVFCTLQNPAELIATSWEGFLFLEFSIISLKL